MVLNYRKHIFVGLKVNIEEKVFEIFDYAAVTYYMCQLSPDML